MSEEEDFGFECHVCKTRLYARPLQVGQHVVCPDCFTQVLVPPPKPRPKKPSVAEDPDADFKLSEPDELPAGPSSGPPGSTVSTPPRGNLLSENARAILAKAEADLQELEAAQPKPPLEFSSIAVFLSFLYDPSAAIRWIVLTLLGHVVAVLFYSVLSLSGGGPMAQFAAMGLGVVSLALALVWVLTASICCLAVLQDTANGYDKIEHWPNASITEWAADACFVLNSAFAAFLPAAFLAAISRWLSLPAGLAGLAAFPCFLLSTLESNSRLMIYSPAIWRTWRVAWPLWQKFLLHSSGVVVVACLGLAGLTCGGFILQALGSAILVASLFVYFRLLGTLARKLAELPPPEETEPEGE